MFETIAFYIFSILTISMFYIVVSTKNTLYALSALATGMIFISAFFFLLSADFLGVVQIIVYTGAVMALYSFGMMFFDTSKNIKEKVHNKKSVYIIGSLMLFLLIVIFAAPLGGDIVVNLLIDHNVGNTQAVGMALFTKYLIPFEVAALMLLVAMVAGIVLAGKKMDVSYTLLTENEIDRLDDEKDNR
jgi:NADH-quinone oxidoreductase subunit J